jgi:hypothetical protein
LLIVAAGAEGVLRETRLSITSSGAETWTAPVVRVPSGVASEPSLTRVSYTEAYLAFVGPDRRVRIGRFMRASTGRAEDEGDRDRRRCTLFGHRVLAKTAR